VKIVEKYKQLKIDFCEEHEWQDQALKTANIFVRENPQTCWWYNTFFDYMILWIKYCPKCGKELGGITKDYVIKNNLHTKDKIGRDCDIDEIYDADEWDKYFIPIPPKKMDCDQKQKEIDADFKEFQRLIKKHPEFLER
jgi:hypothetical protein